MILSCRNSHFSLVEQPDLQKSSGIVRSLQFITASRTFVALHPLTPLTHWYICFLALHGRQLFLDICPHLGTIHQVLDSGEDRFLVGTDLLRRITISESNGLVFQALKIDRDAQWSTKFIITTVTFADRCRRVINAARDAQGSEFVRDSLEMGRKGVM